MIGTKKCGLADAPIFRSGEECEWNNWHGKDKHDIILIVQRHGAESKCSDF